MEHSWMKVGRKRKKKRTHTHEGRERRSGDIAEKSPDDPWEE